MEAEVAAWIEGHKHVTDDDGHRMVVRNGHLPTRDVVTGVGPVSVTQPRVHDRRAKDAVDDDGRPVRTIWHGPRMKTLRNVRNVTAERIGDRSPDRVCMQLL